MYSWSVLEIKICYIEKSNLEAFPDMCPIRFFYISDVQKHILNKLLSHYETINTLYTNKYKVDAVTAVKRCLWNLCNGNSKAINNYIPLGSEKQNVGIKLMEMR